MLPKTVGLFLLLLHDVFVSVNCYSGSAMLKTKHKRSGENRQKRLLSLITDPALNFYFEYNSCYALAVVVSLPLELPSSQSAFLSYNFETNYYYAYFDNAAGLTPLPFSYITEPGTNLGTKHRIQLPPGYRQFGDGAEVSNASANNTEIIDKENVNVTKSSVDQESKSETILTPDDEKKSKKKQKKDKEKLKHRKLRSLLQNYFMSRRRFFKMMESKMDSAGLNGNECILKAICETAAHSFGEHNGVIGSVVDILFLPSASKDEKLPKRYYKAEDNGKLGKCDGYDKMCPTGLFHFISKLI